MPPIEDRIRAVWQWITVSLVMVPLIVLGIFLVPFTILTSKKRANRFGELDQMHSDKYRSRGSSGFWEYRSSDVPILRWFSNYEDGDLGEPSGKWSASRNGNERSFWSRYLWLTWRNPINELKRSHPFFHCIIDDCIIDSWGDYKVDDKGKNWGSHFVRATHRVTGKRYYGYRKTTDVGNGMCRQHRYGFKIKPSHAAEKQDADDQDKAFTIRPPFKTKVN